MVCFKQSGMSLCLIAAWLFLPESALALTRSPSVEASTTREIKLLSRALHDFRAKYGIFPPCMASSDPNRIEHLKVILRNLFPRHEYAEGLPPDLSLENLDPAEALVFFLGGISSTSSGKVTFLGFSLDPKDPLNPSETRKMGKGTGPKFNFDSRRLRDHDQDGFWEYLPNESTTPYVYLDRRSYGQVYHDPQAPSFGTATAYKMAANQWHNSDSFQIITAGQDNNFGSTFERVFPSTLGFVDEDYDNLTNFLDSSFGNSILLKQSQKGYGQLSLAMTSLLAIGFPPLAWVLSRRPVRLSATQLLTVVALAATIMGALTWDANALGRSRYAWFVWEYCFGIALGFFLLSTLATSLHAAKLSPTKQWSKNVYDWSIWIAALPFVFVWWKEPEALERAAFVGYYHRVGWPFSIINSRQIDMSAKALIMNVLVGITVGMVLRFVIWTFPAQFSNIRLFGKSA